VAPRVPSAHTGTADSTRETFRCPLAVCFFLVIVSPLFCFTIRCWFALCCDSKCALSVAAERFRFVAFHVAIDHPLMFPVLFSPVQTIKEERERDLPSTFLFSRTNQDSYFLWPMTWLRGDILPAVGSIPHCEKDRAAVDRVDARWRRRLVG
jgi:hypothetical protein